MKEVTDMIEFTGGPGFAAFIATFSLVLVTLVLMRSLSKQLRKVRTSHHEDAVVVAEPTPGTTNSSIEQRDGDGDEVKSEPRDS